MPARPATLAAATALLVVLALGYAFAGLVLAAALATGTFASADPLARAIVGLVALAAIVMAGAGLASATALWARRPWGWVGSLAIAVVGVAGAVVAVSTSGIQVPLLVGLAMTVVTVALLLVPATRAAATS